MDGSQEDPRRAERLRRALIEHAIQAHDDARLRGLCWEGAWEAAISAMRQLDLGALTDAEALERADART